MRTLLMVLLYLGLAVPLAAQSVYGPGGLFVNPTANMPAPGQWEPSVLVLREHIPPGYALPTSNETTWISSSVDLGDSPRLEFGAAVVAVTGLPGAGDASVGGYAKYLVLQETGHVPAVAVGATLLGLGQVGFREVFVALRKKIPGTPVVGHVGLQYADQVDGVDTHDFRPYAGAEVMLTPRWTFIAEGRPRLNKENGIPMGLTVVRRNPNGYQLALTYANNGFSSTPQFGFGVGFALGSRR